MKTQHTLFQVAVLGGDRRQVSMIRELAGYGYSVCIWGFGAQVFGVDDDVQVFHDWKDAIADAAAVILPLPATLDGIRVNSPDIAENARPRLDVLFREMEGMLLLGGKLSEELQCHAALHDIECIDYFASEPLQLKNALATAEGAISIAMKEIPTTICGTHMAVIGYGRIGELLAHRLHVLGAKVTVYARREEALTRASMAHLNTVKLNGESLMHIRKGNRVIFNTVPECLFDERVVQTLPKDCIFIDLASAPGGIDHLAAQKASLPTIWATALPGKYAPESAGTYIAQTIRSILKERNCSESIGE
ncbi:MAG: hypothetical protein IJX80_06410 [Clostridia bacterium]|nr:hypothetical protein [Clostridia bacterium]